MLDARHRQQGRGHCEDDRPEQESGRPECLHAPQQTNQHEQPVQSRRLRDDGGSEDVVNGMNERQSNGG
jgi:hypothetical protein